ncbi:MAG: alpha-hydroxy-acid oxidizing protein [Burkholderiales bacterium]|nr:alpha-hydroxy-acid oxidizing protein [Anaerolineae bacterium]
MHSSTDYHSQPDVPPLHLDDTREHDACALICAVRKGGEPTHGNVKRTIEALARMGHRTGQVDGEGDGVGILTDIPRQLWAKRLARAGLRSSLATHRSFWVAHLMIPAADRERAANLVEQIVFRINEAGLDVLLEYPGKVNWHVLGPNAEKNEPDFWQIVGMNGTVPAEQLDRTMFGLQVGLERELGVHFASFSSSSVVYKVQGTVEILRRYYPELRDPDFASTVTLGHARYSTNTNSNFERVQPFNLLGHNGEFNTISRFRLEASMVDIPLDPSNSDSQDVDRFLQALCMQYDLDLIEAMEYIFPPFGHDLIQNAPEIHAVYDQVRRAFGPFAQGPAAVVARLGDMAVFSVDALGLRPLWFGETEKEFFATSERGVYPMDAMSAEPRPLAPGEKVAVKITPGRYIEVLDYPAIQRHVLNRARERGVLEGSHDNRHWALDELPLAPVSGSASNGVSNGNGNGGSGKSHNGSSNGGHPVETAVAAAVGAQAAPAAVAVAVAAPTAYPWLERVAAVNTTTMAALGWERYHLSLIDALAADKKEEIGSLGWDGPLAAISQTRENIPDFFKETVAVVTNPAIDREREQAQFSTTMFVGVRPDIAQASNPDDITVKLETPLLIGGHPALGTNEDLRALAHQYGSMTLEDLLDVFGQRVVVLSISAAFDETIEMAVDRLKSAAIEAVLDGAQCVVLDDSDVYDGRRLWLDPMLMTAAIDRALRESGYSPNLRRRAGIVVRSGALRSLHDLALTVAMGANALVPYAMYAVGIQIAPRAPKETLTAEQFLARLGNTLSSLTNALQKVTSTIGCHELRGYGHSISSVGLSLNVAAVFGTPNYFGSDGRGLTWGALRADAEERAAELRAEKPNKLSNPDRFYPKMWKKAENVAHGEMTLEEYTNHLMNLEDEIPIALRHIIGLRENETPDAINPADVDMSIDGYDMPVLIGAMSFGSQGELAYKSYAESAYRLNIICVNGEGGELPDVMGKYPHHRGNQVASARFGVNIEFLNSCEYLEIKIGQGAKPGEGGQLPGYKVTEQVAAARKTTPGVALISPSNNHDLYSIEDLAQLIDELKTANPYARISVKIPVVPGVGIIAVGVAKAGADIINITGYDGGTGAARAHSLRYVGLPAEIGVWLSHRALIESGLRDDVELWCDGGMKSGRDVVKMLCMGANRVGFGTLAMVAVGCTICRGCQDGTCHVGITTHIKTKEEATLKGLKSFEPRDYEDSVQGIVNVFHMLGDDIRKWTAKLGFTRTQDLVGRADLLEQIAMHDKIDLTPLTRRVPYTPKGQVQPGVGLRLSRPRAALTREITHIVGQHIAWGELELTYDDEQVMAMDRALGTHLSGALQRQEFENAADVKAVHLNFSSSALPGNGLAAFLDDPVNVLVEGGAQDGVAKCAKGGKVTILKGLNHNGQRLDGSVGKSFAYGAQGGRFIVQGNADSRACIRLSGADVIFGGLIDAPLRDELGGLAARSNLKGYACEYMTSGRVVILGDPGPWMCAGMSGGAIYQRIQPEMNLDVDAIRRRIAKGATVEIFRLDENAIAELRELLGYYIQALELNNQPEAAQPLYVLLRCPEDHFVKIAAPQRVQ